MTSHRRTAAAAFAVILASVSLYPVFDGVAWFWTGCASAIVVALAGTATRLRRLPVAVVLLAGVVALLLYLNLAFSNARSLWHLLPTPASLAALLNIAGQGFNEASRYAPPVPELRGMLLLAAAGIGITALLTDLIAVRLRSAALAGLPLLLLFTEPFTLSVSRGFFGTTIVFCATVIGYLALLSSEARDRIREWEHPNPSANDVPDTRTLAAAGRRVGFASVVIALCLPLFIPGLHMTRLFGSGQPGIGGSGGSGGSGNAAVGFPDPNTQLSLQLHSAQASNVLVYTTSSTSPDYLQIYTLDRLTGSGWRLFGQPESLVPVSPRLPAPPGLTATSSLARESTTITLGRGVGQDELAALPVPYPATTVTANGSLRADKSTLMVFDSGVQLAGLKYTVTSLAQTPPQQLLNAAPPPPANITTHYLSVPSAYDSLRSLAVSVVRQASAKTQFEDAVALQNWLANGSFKYTLNAPTVINADGLAKFLKVTKKGYCQQFSFAMAVMARLLGIPSRIAYGFTSGAPVSGNSWRVTTHDAHAWPELYFQGSGWLRFEPTPNGPAGQGTAFSPTYSLGPADPLSPDRPRATPSTAPTAGKPGLTGVPPDLRNLFLNQGGTGEPGAAKASTVSPWEIFGLVVAGLVVLAAVAPWCARRVIRRRRWRRLPRARATAATGAKGTPGTARADRVRARDVAWAHAAWRELRDDLTDYGAGSLPSESPRAVAARAGDGLGLGDPARAALGRIAMAEERARYAPAPADGAGLRADSAVVRRAIAAAVPRGARWRARLLPASVLVPALTAIASAADLYRGSRGGRLLRRTEPSATKPSA
jgi:transglutaminase-like putative cysteine protease